MVINRNQALWFTRQRNKNARFRLICFHFAGGGASFFRKWAEMLPEWIEVTSVQLPGRERRIKESLISNSQQIIKSILEAIPPYLNLPYVLFGHSMGALLSYELAKSIIKSNDHPFPKLLIVSGRPAPSDPNIYYKKISHLEGPDFLKRLIDQGGIPKSVLENKELMKFYEPILKADIKIAESPVTPGRVSCPIFVFGGKSDKITEKNLQLWSLETTNSCNVQMFPGEHFFVKSAEGLVLQKVSQLLNLVNDSLLI